MRSKAQVIPAPVLIVSLVSSLLPSAETSSSRAPTEIRFPEYLDLDTCIEGASPFRQNIVPKYDLVSVISSSGTDPNRFSFHFKTDPDSGAVWRGGLVGSELEVVDRNRAVSGNFYGPAEPKVLPRLLVYIRRDFPEVLEELHIDDEVDSRDKFEHPDVSHSRAVSKYRGSSKRGYDETVASSECAACASETCSICAAESSRALPSNKSDDGSDLHDYEAPRPTLPAPSGLSAAALEEQADLALANRRLKDAVDIYGRAIAACGSSGSSSENVKNLQDKRERVTRLIRLDTSVLLVEKGERALSRNAFSEARVHYVKAAHSQDISHLKIIISEIDQNIKLQTASQKIVDAQAAMRAGQYQAADDLFKAAIALNPEKAATLESVQATLAPLIRTENAQVKQKIGLQAFEEKRFLDALNLLSEAISLLPESSSLLPVYFCDRAAVHCEMKDFASAIVNCEQALAINGDFALAYFRMGTACFGYERLDDALANYEKAVKLDQSLNDQVKIKIRQVNSSREIQQRKERESERAKQREEEQRAIQEKRVREEQLKKEKAEKLAIEKAEKLERQRLKDEERRLKAEKEKAEQDAKMKEKEAEKEKLREERLKKEAERLQEREAQKLEKERDRERQKKEKEQRLRDQQRALEEEKRRREEFAQEMARVELNRKEVEKQKDAEKEKARIEMENLIAEREKARASGAAAVADAPAAESSSVARSNCSKCSLVMDGSSRYFSLGHCNHRLVCSVCTLRMRSSNFGETDLTCPECRQSLDCVVCTLSDQPFSKFQVPGNPGPDLQYDKKSRIFFPKEYFRTVVEKIWKFSCPSCQFDSPDIDLFSKHLQTSHKLSVCQLCFKNNRQFPNECDTYATDAYEKHLNGVPENETEISGGGHPKCGHCDQRFYNESLLLVHLNDSHVSCSLCNPEIIISNNGDSTSRAVHLSGLFFPDAKDLKNHHIAVHHLCQNHACREKIVVFRTQSELDDHTSAIHTQSFTMRQAPISSAPYYGGPQGSPPSGAPPFIPQGKPTGYLGVPAVASGIPSSSLPIPKWSGGIGPPVAPPIIPLQAGGSSWTQLPGSRRIETGIFDGSDPLPGGIGDVGQPMQYPYSDFPQTSTFNVKAAEFKPSFAVQSTLLGKGPDGSSGSSGNLGDAGHLNSSNYPLDIGQGKSFGLFLFFAFYMDFTRF